MSPSIIWSKLYLLVIVLLISWSGLKILIRLGFTPSSRVHIIHRLVILCRWLYLLSFGLSLFSLGWLFLPTPQVIKPDGPLTTVDFKPEAPFVLQFDRPVSRTLKPELYPSIPGQWRYGYGNFGPLFPDRYLFTPDKPLPADTEYTLSLEQILPITWLSLQQSQPFLFVFATPSSGDLPYSPSIIPTDSHNSQNPSTATQSAVSPTPQKSFSLPVPLLKQHFKFTCFSAASQMVLAYRQVKDITELGFLKEIGYDSTPRNQVTGIWGDPDVGIVGTYDGAAPGGYGVHWEPVAKALSTYREVKIMRQWNLDALLQQIKAGNPVMVWWVNGVWPAKELTWATAEGKRIRAVNGLHVEVVTGWEGLQSKPDYILTNDPWRGYRRYSIATFNSLWKWFDNTALVVY